MSVQDSSHSKTTCSRSATQCWQSITCYIIISTSMYLHLSDDEYTEAPVSMYFNTKHCVPLRITPKQKGKSVSCSCSFRIGSIVQSGYIDHMHTSPHLCNVLSQDRFCWSWSELDCPVRGGGLVGSYVCCHHTSHETLAFLLDYYRLGMSQFVLGSTWVLSDIRNHCPVTDNLTFAQIVF